MVNLKKSGNEKDLTIDCLLGLHDWRGWFTDNDVYIYRICSRCKEMETEDWE